MKLKELVLKINNFERKRNRDVRKRTPALAFDFFCMHLFVERIVYIDSEDSGLIKTGYEK